MRLVQWINGAITRYPYRLQDLMTDYPGVSFPDDLTNADLSEQNAWVVTEVLRPQPSNPLTKRVVEAQPNLVDGVFVQVWVEENLPADQAAENQRVAGLETYRLETKADAFVQQFIAMTPADIDAFMEANVTNLAQARTMFKRICKMMLLLARREFG